METRYETWYKADFDTYDFQELKVKRETPETLILSGRKTEFKNSVRHSCYKSKEEAKQALLRALSSSLEYATIRLEQVKEQIEKVKSL